MLAECSVYINLDEMPVPWEFWIGLALAAVSVKVGIIALWRHFRRDARNG